jgi:2-succinyl-6-hydroxy-2,4-cyclohexadiene-1-carboxylate synthase
MQKKIKSFDGNYINYDIERISDKFIVFLHGAGGELAAWEEIRNFFTKKKISTIAIDLRGHGLSERPNSIRDYRLKNFAKDIYKVINKEKIKKFIIVGHCFGGIITIIFHELFPKKAKAYVLIATSHKAPKNLKIVFKKNFFTNYILNNYLEKSKSNGKNKYRNYNKIIPAKDWDLINILQDITHTSLKSWIYTYENMSKFKGKKILNSIKKPVLIIHGDKDTVIKASASNKINKFIKNSQLEIIPNENHLIIINNPKRIYKEINKFISKLY